MLAIISLLWLANVARSLAQGLSTIYNPPASYKIPRTLYARTLLTSNNTLLATWEDYGPEPPSLPVYESRDGGRSWRELGRVRDQIWGWGLRYQPFLYELPADFAGFARGTLLMAGSAIPKDLAQTQLELYASGDGGRSWKFVSHIARGGKALPNNGETPVWEPFLLLHNNKLLYHYSDQRDPRHGQKLVHQASRDLRHWEPPVNDVTNPDYASRPGMTTIARLPNGRFILTYEECRTGRSGCPVFYRIAADPTRFDAAPSFPLKATDGKQPSGSPYVVWTATGGPAGTLVVSTSSSADVFLHGALGDPKVGWRKVATGAPAAYTRCLTALREGEKILITGAGVLKGKNNSVTAAVFKVPG